MKKLLLLISLGLMTLFISSCEWDVDHHHHGHWHGDTYHSHEHGDHHHTNEAAYN